MHDCMYYSRCTAVIAVIVVTLFVNAEIKCF